jgi:hypothetical protein
MSFYAGADWSGKPDKPIGAVDIFSFAVAAFPDLEALNEACIATKRDLGMPAIEEFHAHNMSDAMNAAVLEMGMRLGMRVGILIVNKTAVPVDGKVLLPDPARFTQQISMKLLEQFVPHCPLSRLWCDEDIKGSAAQKEFKTAVRRVCRAHHPDISFEMGFRRSHTSFPVQMADVVAYVLSRQARGSKFEPPLENVLRKIRKNEQHLILGPLPWEERTEEERGDLRPYPHPARRHQR